VTPRQQHNRLRVAYEILVEIAALQNKGFRGCGCTCCDGKIWNNYEQHQAHEHLRIAAQEVNAADRMIGNCGFEVVITK